MFANYHVQGAFSFERAAQVLRKQQRNGLLLSNASLALCPVTLRRGLCESIGKVLAQLLGSFVRIHGKCFGGSPVAFAEWIGFSQHDAHKISAHTRPISSEVLYRADIYISRGEWKLLELNVGSNIGGFDRMQMGRAYLADAKLGPYLRRCRITFDNSSDEWLRFIRHSIGKRTGLIAFLEARESIADIQGPIQLALQGLRELGVDAQLVAHDEVSQKGRSLYIGKLPIGMVYRLYDVKDVLADSEGFAPLETSRHNCLNPMGLECSLYGSKQSLTLVHEEEFSHCFSSAELAIFRKVVPRTIPLDLQTLDLAIQQRNDWVLKPALGYGGLGVVCGSESTDSDWTFALRQAVGAGVPYVLQEFVPNEAVENYLLLPAGDIVKSELRYVFGIYMIGARYIGCSVRALSAPQGSIVCMHRGAAGGVAMYGEEA